MKRIALFIALLTLTALACQTLAAPTVEPFIVSTEAPLPTQPEPVQQPQSNTPPLTESQVPRIEVDKAKAAVDSGAAVLIDVRSADAYASGHAAGAISIPLGNFETNIESLSLEKSQWIITYCT
jgi:3-mercaptopyruvate sulfurtransferase SseA